MHPWKNDVAVLCIFFARPEIFRQTFEQVRKARPRVLLLWQDGPRKGNAGDVDKIAECRAIAENIDWDCEVHRRYNEENYGCDPSTFMSHKWAFSIVDKCIILEDDLVVSQSFFPYCKELLDRYEYDTRICRICGLNHFGVTKDCSDSYFFSHAGSVWGWATWRRVAEQWDETYSILDDPAYQDELKSQIGEAYLKKCWQHKNSGKAHWETILSLARVFNNMLEIVPACNMVHNIGLGENSTHASDHRLLPKNTKSLFHMEKYELEFPLKHPRYIVPNDKYFQKVGQRSRHNLVSAAFIHMRHFEFELLFKKIYKRIRRTSI